MQQHLVVDRVRLRRSGATDAWQVLNDAHALFMRNQADWRFYFCGGTQDPQYLMVYLADAAAHANLFEVRLDTNELVACAVVRSVPGSRFACGHYGPPRPMCTIAIIVDKRHRGLGLAKSIFRTLTQLVRAQGCAVCWTAAPHNKPSAAVARACGMKPVALGCRTCCGDASVVFQVN